MTSMKIEQFKKKIQRVAIKIEEYERNIDASKRTIEHLKYQKLELTWEKEWFDRDVNQKKWIAETLNASDETLNLRTTDSSDIATLQTMSQQIITLGEQISIHQKKLAADEKKLTDYTVYQEKLLADNHQEITSKRPGLAAKLKQSIQTALHGQRKDTTANPNTELDAYVATEEMNVNKMATIKIEQLEDKIQQAVIKIEQCKENVEAFKSQKSQLTWQRGALAKSLNSVRRELRRKIADDEDMASQQKTRAEITQVERAYNSAQTQIVTLEDQMSNTQKELAAHEQQLQNYTAYKGELLTLIDYSHQELIKIRSGIVTQFKQSFQTKPNSQHTDFIMNLNTKLDNYITTGKIDEILAYATQNIGSNFDVRLRTRLSQMIVQLMDSHSDFDPNKDLSTEAQDTLADLAEKTKSQEQAQEYIQSIRDLYQKIANIQKEGKKLPKGEEKITVLTLAEQLKKDVDYFVYKHPEMRHTSEEYSQFQTKITARLHSQDEVMSKYENRWKPILLNVFLAVVTVGIALGVKAAHSKYTTGSVSLFGDNSIKGRLQEIKSKLDDKPITPTPSLGS